MPLLTNQASRFLGGGKLPVPQPTLGAELVTNGDFSSATGWTPTGTWTIGSGVASVTDGAAGFGVTQNGKLTAGQWYQSRITVVSVAANGVSCTDGSGNVNPSKTTTGAALWAFRALGTQIAFVARTGVTTATIDDASVKQITLASMFSTRTYTTHATTKAMATITAGTQAGVVANLDSATSPANFVVATHNGTNAILTKCVAGTYTQLISTAVTYVAGAYVEIRRPAGGDIWQLFYGGTQRGTDQTISDAAIQAATLHGLFNTYSGNTLTAFSCVPS